MSTNEPCKLCTWSLKLQMPYCGWCGLHLKLNSDTFIAVDYAGSNGMEDDEPVTSVDIESLIKGSNNTCRSLT